MINGGGVGMGVGCMDNQADGFRHGRSDDDMMMRQNMRYQRGMLANIGGQVQENAQGVCYTSNIIGRGVQVGFEFKANWSFALKGRLTESELMDINTQLNEKFAAPNAYGQKIRNLMTGCFILALPTFGMSMILVGLPASAVMQKKHGELLSQAFAACQTLSVEWNKTFANRGVHMCVRFRDYFNMRIPQLVFDFDTTRVHQQMHVAESIPLAAVATTSIAPPQMVKTDSHQSPSAPPADLSGVSSTASILPPTA